MIRVITRLERKTPISVRWMLRTGGATATVLMVTTAALGAASGLIHLHLWTTGYDKIPTIGPLFLVQAITELLVAGLLATTRRPLLALGASGLAIGTIGGFLLSVYVGLFGFMDSFSAPWGTTALVIEIIAVGTGLLSCVVAARRRSL